MKSKRLKTLPALIVAGLALLTLHTAARAQTATFTNPIVKSQDAADPWMLYRDGFYYFTFTAGNRIEIWKAATITGIGSGTKTVVWQAPPAGPQCCNIWAPELHFINGRWYIYYAADDGNDVNHRMYVLESTSTDALGPYVSKGKIAATTDRWAIDGSVLQRPDGSLYFVWSGWANLSPGPQNIYIAPMSNPWTISGERTLISAPVNSWETVGWAVNQGPEALQKAGKTFIVYSASGGSTAYYCLGMLTNADGQMLNPASWQKSPGCVFSRTESVFGPGHNSFVKSPDQTEDWLIYHARDSAFPTWAGRTARAQKFTWNADSTPNFGRPIAAGVALPVPSGEVKATAPPVLLAQEADAQRAAALDSVTFLRDPFPVTTARNFSADRRTRLVLFATNAALRSEENASVLTAEAEDASQKVFPLAVEYVGQVSGFDWLTEIVVRLPDALEQQTGDLRISINLRGSSSNKLLFNVAPAANATP